MIRRSLKRVAIGLGAVVAVLAAAAGAFVWTLARHPVSLAAFVPMLERELSPADGRFRVAIGDLVLSWVDDADGSDRLDIRAQGVRAFNADGAVLAEVPEMGVGVSLGAVFGGHLRPTRLDLVRPRVTVVRRADGSFGFDIADAPGAEAEDLSDAERGQGTPLVADLLGALGRAPDAREPLGLMNTLVVTDAELRARDRATGRAWHASRADITLVRGAAGVAGRARLALDLGGDTVPVEALVSHDHDDGTTAATLRFVNLDPARLAALTPGAQPLDGVRLPVDGRVDVGLDGGFRIARAAFDLAADGGTLVLPMVREEPYRVRTARLRGAFAVAERRLTVEEAALDMDGLALTAAGQAELGGGGAAGSARLTLAAGPRTAVVEVDATATRLTARVRDLEPALFAGLAPVLAPLRALAAPLSGTAELDLGDGLQPLRGRLALDGGGGRLAPPVEGAEPVALSGATLRADADFQAGRYRLERLSVGLGGPALEASATATTSAGTLALAADLSVHDMPLDDLHRYWPPTAGRNARTWVTENLTAGVVTGAAVRIEGTAPAGDPAAFVPTMIDGTIRAAGATVHYLRPLPPVEGVERVEARTDGKTMTIRTEGGHIADVQAGDGTIRIINLGTPREDIDIRVGVEGPVATILGVLDLPPLGYPGRLDLDPKRTSGTATAQLHLAFPLFESLKLEDMELGVTAKLRGAGVEALIRGQPVTDGALDLALTMKGMEVKGRARLAGIPLAVDWKEQFDSAAKGPPTRIAVTGRATVEELRPFGLVPPEGVSGTLAGDLLFTASGKKGSTLAATLDLAGADLAVAPLGWSKPVGTPASARFTADFAQGQVVRIGGIAVEGNGLSATGRVEFAQESRFAAARDLHLAVGRTDLRGAVVAEEGGYAVTLTGPSLDAGPFLEDGGSKKGGTSAADAPLPPLSIDARVNELHFGADRPLSKVSVKAQRDAAVWTAIDAQAISGGRQEVSLLWRPRGNRHELLLRADDAGAALRALDLTDRVRGGRLRIQGTAKTPAAPLTGTVEAEDYTLVNAPALARILNAMSITGLAELMGSKGITFGQLRGSFVKDGPELTLKEVRTAGGALGLTAEGTVNLDTDVAALSGTIVPVYGINRIIGQIPVIGDALSGGKGQGIFAATWSVEGPLDDPQVGVNPLAVLAPGFLRNLFSGLEADSAAPPAWEAPAPARPD